MGVRVSSASLVSFLIAVFVPHELCALDPAKSLTQYTRTVWTEVQGLPQETVRAITQTSDGYLWLGTSEGLARFDGYDFVTFSKADGFLPSNSVTALYAGHSGNLWIGTIGGLSRYSDGSFKTFTTKDGLSPGTVSSLVEDRAGRLWIVSGGRLNCFQNGKFIVYPRQDLGSVSSVRVVYQDAQQQLWIGGVSGAAKLAGGHFVPVLRAKDLGDNVITSMLKDDAGLWVSGTNGIDLLRPNGNLTHFGRNSGLPSNLVRALCKDRAGSLWVGTNGGLSRFEDGRFVSFPYDPRQDREWVWALFEDREGDLWAGMNNSLTRFKDDPFATYGRSEGFPGDDPVVVHQDGRGQIWVGYHDNGLVEVQNGKLHAFTVKNGLPSNEIFSIRDGRNGDLLIATRGGLCRFHDGRILRYSVPDPAGRLMVFDSLEDSRGELWAATPSGVYLYAGGRWHPMTGGGTTPDAYAIALAEGRDGIVWAGGLTSGLWQIPSEQQGRKPRLYTMVDGLGSNQVRSIYMDSDGTLWVGTFGGGLTMFRDGLFHHYTSGDGLLSDNISHVEQDANQNLWLSTTRGICRIPKHQLADFNAGMLRRLTPENFGIADGLRSSQCAPAFPAGGGGTRTRDGHLWFPTGRGLATIDPIGKAPNASSPLPVPLAHIVAFAVDGRDTDITRVPRLPPGTGRIQFRYTGVYLNAPERVVYSYKLEGLDPDWVPSGNRRVTNYNPLPHGHYRFLVRAMVPNIGASQSQVDFDVLPYFYQTQTFRWLCIGVLMAAVYGIYQLRLKQLHSRFALVLGERARLAREIHDTLAQGFVGISSQLDALALKLNEEPSVVRQHLDLARRMARHSLTEARRSVTDLRMSELEEQNLPTALSASARRWAAGASVDVHVDVSGDLPELPGDLEHNLLRVAQEAVANALKHARARAIWVELKMEQGILELRVKDNGRGFEPAGALSLAGGHYGILGMQERAAKLGGKFQIASHLGSGTQVEVRVPLASRNTKIN